MLPNKAVDCLTCHAICQCERNAPSRPANCHWRKWKATSNVSRQIKYIFITIPLPRWTWRDITTHIFSIELNNYAVCKNDIFIYTIMILYVYIIFLCGYLIILYKDSYLSSVHIYVYKYTYLSIHVYLIILHVYIIILHAYMNILHAYVIIWHAYIIILHV